MNHSLRGRATKSALSEANRAQQCRRFKAELTKERNKLHQLQFEERRFRDTITRYQAPKRSLREQLDAIDSAGSIPLGPTGRRLLAGRLAGIAGLVAELGLSAARSKLQRDYRTVVETIDRAERGLAESLKEQESVKGYIAHLGAEMSELGCDHLR